jgi:hypothetical protein
VRLVFLFALTGYAYMFKEDGVFAKSGAAYVQNVGDDLKNSIVFTWGFLELAAWFWVCLGVKIGDWSRTDVRQVFVTIRDERRQRMMRVMQKRQAEFKAQNDML